MRGRTLLISLLLHVGCVTADNDGSNGGAALLEEHTLALGSALEREPLLMRTAPNATCLLHQGNPDDKTRRLWLFADDEGFVRFYFSGTPADLPDLRFRLDCQAQDGTALSAQSVEGRTLASSKAPVLSGTTLPALKGNPLAPTETEILKLGYRPRPDPAKDPEAYADWLAAVSRDAIQVRAASTPHPDQLSHAVVSPSEQSNGALLSTQNWSGYELAQPGAQYGDIQGKIVSVPDLVAGGFPPWVAQYYSSFWPGLDGGTGVGTDIMQAGIYMNMFVTNDIHNNYYGVGSYQGWAQWFRMVPM